MTTIEIMADGRVLIDSPHQVVTEDREDRRTITVHDDPAEWDEDDVITVTDRAWDDDPAVIEHIAKGGAK